MQELEQFCHLIPQDLPLNLSLNRLKSSFNLHDSNSWVCSSSDFLHRERISYSSPRGLDQVWEWPLREGIFTCLKDVAAIWGAFTVSNGCNPNRVYFSTVQLRDLAGCAIGCAVKRPALAICYDRTVRRGSKHCNPTNRCYSSCAAVLHRDGGNCWNVWEEQEATC